MACAIEGYERQGWRNLAHGMKASQEEDFLERNGTKRLEQEEEGV